MLKFFYKLFNTVTSVYSFIIFYFGAFAVHIFTCYVVYESYGMFLGIISFFCPVMSTVIVFILYLIFYGLFNDFCMAILFYLMLVCIAFLFAYISSLLESKLLNTKNNNSINFTNKEIIDSLVKKSGLSRKICADIFQILKYFNKNQPTQAYDFIDNILIPDLKNMEPIGNVGIAFGMLVSDKALSQEEAQTYAESLILDMVNSNSLME